MYVNQDIAARHIEYHSLNIIESIWLKLNLRKRKWLVVGIYKPPGYSEDAFIKSLFSYLTNAKKRRVWKYCFTRGFQLDYWKY